MDSQLAPQQNQDEPGRPIRGKPLTVSRLSVFPYGVLPPQLARSPAIQHMFKLPRPKSIPHTSVNSSTSTSAQKIAGTDSSHQAEAPIPSNVSAAVPLSPEIPIANDPWVFEEMRSETVAVERGERAEERLGAGARDLSPRLMERNVSRPRTRECRSSVG
jgi:hypothetical protein